VNDQLRTAIIALAQSTFPVLVLLGVVDLSEVQIGGIMLVITNAITVLALIFKQGQEPGS